MKYYIVAGEASGDLHASHLMHALREYDSDASFRCIGGDMMKAQQAALVRHYRELAYMGIVPVLTHLPQILRGMRECRRDVLDWNPDALILVDYPGFNLSLGKYIKRKAPHIKIFYYISPKIWAWKEWRIRDIRLSVDRLFSILPFEVDYFRRRHQYDIDYVGNPTRDEVQLYEASHPADFSRFIEENSLLYRPVIAILAGSRRQEIKDNLSRMLRAAAPFSDRYQLIVAGAPGIDRAFYYDITRRHSSVRVLYGQTYRLLQHSTAALVTSGTATLETALFRVPQVVCYYLNFGRLFRFLRRRVIKVPYISLVNLIADKEVVPELVADEMTVERVRQQLADILPDGPSRAPMLEGYEEVIHRLGEPGAPHRAAERMIALLREQR